MYFSRAHGNSLLWSLERFYWKQLLPRLASTDTSAACTTPESLPQSAVALRWKTKQLLFKKRPPFRSFNSMLWEVLMEVTEDPPHTQNAAQAVLKTGAWTLPSQFDSDSHFILFQAAFLGQPRNELYSQLNQSRLHFLERSGSLPELIANKKHTQPKNAHPFWVKKSHRGTLMSHLDVIKYWAALHPPPLRLPELRDQTDSLRKQSLKPDGRVPALPKAAGTCGQERAFEKQLPSRWNTKLSDPRAGRHCDSRVCRTTHTLGLCLITGIKMKKGKEREEAAFRTLLLYWHHLVSKLTFTLGEIAEKTPT